MAKTTFPTVENPYNKKDEPKQYGVAQMLLSGKKCSFAAMSEKVGGLSPRTLSKIIGALEDVKVGLRKVNDPEEGMVYVRAEWDPKQRLYMQFTHEKMGTSAAPAKKASKKAAGKKAAKAPQRGDKTEVKHEKSSAKKAAKKAAVTVPTKKAASKKAAPPRKIKLPAGS